MTRYGVIVVILVIILIFIIAAFLTSLIFGIFPVIWR
jgi:hypothetical protein